MIQPVESLEITVLVDNGTDSLSTSPGFVETEIAGALAAGDEMAERTVLLLRRPWRVLPDHHPDPVVTTSVRHGPGRVHLRAQRHQARRTERQTAPRRGVCAGRKCVPQDSCRCLRR
jgi:hypothetical protein